MDYKQKYEEALERAKMYQGMTVLPAESMIETIFPELKESEDERIRGAIMHFISHTPTVPKGIINKEQMLAWLEKQGKRDVRYENLEELLEADTIYQMAMNDAMVNEAKEKAAKALSKLGIGKLLCFEKKGEQNHSEQNLEMVVEPKFKVGDWVIGRVTDNEPRQIAEITEEGYKTTYDGWIGFSFEEDIHLWTIKDAKDGDVLKEDSCTFIIERMNPDGTAIIHCCLFDDGDFDLGSTLSFDVDSTKPATKEQRDLLFQKMKELGYEWDAEKKELKLLITNGGDFCESENCEQKPAGWSEEDERNLQGVIDEIEANKNQAPDYDIATYDRFLSWLKSLKERYKETVIMEVWKMTCELYKDVKTVYEVISYLQAMVETLEKECAIRDGKKPATELFIRINSLKREINKIASDYEHILRRADIDQYGPLSKYIRPYSA